MLVESEVVELVVDSEEVVSDIALFDIALFDIALFDIALFDIALLVESFDIASLDVVLFVLLSPEASLDVSLGIALLDESSCGVAVIVVSGVLLSSSSVRFCVSAQIPVPTAAKAARAIIHFSGLDFSPSKRGTISSFKPFDFFIL